MYESHDPPTVAKEEARAGWRMGEGFPWICDGRKGLGDSKRGEEWKEV